jgi:hypothetical protein
MRSLSSALQNRHHQEGATSHRPVGGGCRDGHARCHHGGRERDHAVPGQASARPLSPAGTGRDHGGHRVRPGGPGGVRHRADRDRGKVPAVGGYGGSPERRPPAVSGIPRAGQIIGPRQIAGVRRGAAPGWRSARRQPPRRARRRSAFGPAACAEPDERVFPGWPDRRAQGRPRAGVAGRPGHPGNPADRRAGPGSAARRAEPGPAAARLGRSPASSWLPAGDGSREPRPGAVCSPRAAATSGPAPRSHAPPGGAAYRPQHAAARSRSAAATARITRGATARTRRPAPRHCPAPRGHATRGDGSRWTHPAGRPGAFSRSRLPVTARPGHRSRRARRRSRLCGSGRPQARSP